MNAKIITKKLSPAEYNDLTKAMKRRIQEYLNALIEPSEEFIEWYSQTDWNANTVGQIFDELWDDDENYLGFGVDGFHMKVILTEQTQADIKAAYMAGKKEAIEEYRQENNKPKQYNIFDYL